MAVNVSLVVTIVAFSILIALSFVLFVIKFSHPEDDTGIFPKVVAICSFTLSFVYTFLVPSNGVINRTKKDINSGNDLRNVTTIDLDIMFLVLSICLLLFLCTVIPFSLFFFKSAFVGTGKQYLGKRISYSLIAVGVCAVIFLAVSLPLYFLEVLGKLGFVETAVAALDIAAWFPFSILLGIGMVSLPTHLFLYWYYRPTPMQRDQYDEQRMSLGNRARSLRLTGEKLESELSSKGFFEKKKLENSFTEAVRCLKDDYIQLQTCFLFKGGNPIIPWVLLVLSIVCGIFSLFWIVQIIITPIVYIYDLLGSFLYYVTFGEVYVLTFMFYSSFALYLFFATIFGLLQISHYAPFLVLGYKMESHNTYNDAFLINSGIFIFLSIPLVHFTVITMLVFTPMTTPIGTFFAKFQSKGTLNILFRYVFFGIIFTFNILTVLFHPATSSDKHRTSSKGILYFVWPPKRNEKLEQALNKMSKN